MKIILQDCVNRTAYKLWVYREDGDEIKYLKKDMTWGEAEHAYDIWQLPEPLLVVSFSDMSRLADQFRDERDVMIPKGVRGLFKSKSHSEPTKDKAVNTVIRNAINDLLKYLG